jgi:hypothetical protein
MKKALQLLSLALKNESLLSDAKYHLLSLIAEFSRHFRDILKEIFLLVKTPLMFKVDGVYQIW